jgi:hypothetical protein
VFFAAVFGERGELHDGAGEKSLGHMKLMYIHKAVVKFNNSQPWQANQKNQIVRDACMHQVLQPNLNIVLGSKKSKLQHVDFVLHLDGRPLFLGSFFSFAW